jgi:hypothetical protein
MVLNQLKAGGYLFYCDFKNIFRFKNILKPGIGNYNKIKRTTQPWV